MVYPSHYARGTLGFDVPGNHPELVGFGTKGAVGQVASGHGTALVRPWVQAMNYESPDYGPQYLAQELKSSGANGGTGWLMWNPSQDYGTAWAAVPRRVEKDERENRDGAVALAAPTRARRRP
jgi:hypothetical protein